MCRSGIVSKLYWINRKLVNATQLKITRMFVENTKNSFLFEWIFKFETKLKQKIKLTINSRLQSLFLCARWNSIFFPSKKWSIQNIPRVFINFGHELFFWWKYERNGKFLYLFWRWLGQVRKFCDLSFGWSSWNHFKVSLFVKSNFFLVFVFAFWFHEKFAVKF